MAQRRIYPAWLPPTADQRAALIRIRRRQTLVLLWMIAFLPAGWFILALTPSNVILVPLTILWIGFGVSLARRLTQTACPRCDSSFCQKAGMPYLYALFNNRCESCGLTLYPRNVDEDGTAG
jgi:Na+/proline symporter